MVSCDKNSMCSDPICDLLNSSRNVGMFFELYCKGQRYHLREHSASEHYIDKLFRSELQGKRFLLLAAINHNRPHAHCFAQLHALDANTPAAAREYYPLTTLQTRVDQSTVHLKGAYDNQLGSRTPVSLWRTLRHAHCLLRLGLLTVLAEHIIGPATSSGTPSGILHQCISQLVLW